MDGRLLALGIALAVTLIGVGTIIVTMPPIDTESDYTLLDKVSGGEVEPGLYYSYTRDSDIYGRQLEITVVDVRYDGVVAEMSDRQRFGGGMWTCDTENLCALLFDYSDPSEIPDGISVVTTDMGDDRWLYTIDGTGTIDDSILSWNKHITCTFENLVIENDESYGVCISMTGKVSFSGTRSMSVPEYAVEYKDMVLAYSSDYEPGVCVATGAIDAEGTVIYLSADSFAENLVTFTPNYSVILKADEVMYASVKCDRYTLHGNDGVNDYDHYISILHSKYVIKGDGTVNGEDVTERVDIYYKDE